MSATESSPHDLLWSTDFEAVLRARMASFEHRTLDDGGRSGAAVALVVLPDEEGRAAVILTRRALSLRKHAGQYALPGGRRDDGESLEDTALRELHEEVDLRLGAEHVIGRLDDFATRSGFLITPVVIWGTADAEMHANPDEVAAIYRIPLTQIVDPQIAHRTPTQLGEMISLAIVGTHVFAPTAAIMYQLAELAVHGRTIRVAGAEQPRFAWS